MPKYVTTLRNDTEDKIIRDTAQAKTVLHSLCKEMEERYRLMNLISADNINSYNQMLTNKQSPTLLTQLLPRAIGLRHGHASATALRLHSRAKEFPAQSRMSATDSSEKRNTRPHSRFLPGNGAAGGF